MSTVLLFASWFALTVACFFAGVALVLRMGLRGTYPVLLGGGMCGTLILELPLYLLAVSNTLYRVTAAVSVGAAAALVLGLCLRGGDQSPRVQSFVCAVRDIVKAPVRAVRTMCRENLAVGIACTVLMVFIVWSAVTAWLAPSWRSFDALWYHGAIIGSTLAEHGFRVLNLPDTLGLVNTHPRVCEMLSVWCAVITDARLVDIPNSAYAVFLWVGVFLVVRPFARSAVEAAGWGAVSVMVPGVLYQLQSVYTDIPSSGFLIAAVYFLLVAPVRANHGFVGSVALALAVGAKHYAWAPTPLLIALWTLRCILDTPESSMQTTRWKRTVQYTLMVCALPALSLGFLTLRAVWLHGNPLYPMKYDIPLLGIHWDGPWDYKNLPEIKRTMKEIIGQIYQSPGAQVMAKTLRRGGFLRHGLGWPHYIPPHMPEEYDPVNNYGLAVPWLLVPLATVGLLVLVYRTGRSVLPWKRASVPETGLRTLATLWGLVLFGYIFVKVQNHLQLSRYHAPAFAVMAAVGCYALRSSRWERTSHGLLTAALAVSLWMPLWQKPQFHVNVKEAKRLVGMGWPEREISTDAGAPVELEMATAREKETRGETIVFSDDLMEIGMLWNTDFSNHLVYLPDDENLPTRAAEMGAKWLVCTPVCSHYMSLFYDPDHVWEYRGSLSPYWPSTVWSRSTARP